jgi:hypothetical protein
LALWVNQGGWSKVDARDTALVTLATLGASRFEPSQKLLRFTGSFDKFSLPERCVDVIFVPAARAQSVSSTVISWAVRANQYASRAENTTHNALTTESPLICIVSSLLLGIMSLGIRIELGTCLDLAIFMKILLSKKTWAFSTLDMNVMVAAKNRAKSNGFGMGTCISSFSTISMEVHSLWEQVSSNVYSWGDM